MNLQSISVLQSAPELSKNKDRCFHRWVLFIYSTFETGIGFRRDHDSVGTRKKSLDIFKLVLQLLLFVAWFRIHTTIQYQIGSQIPICSISTRNFVSIIFAFYGTFFTSCK